jgi:hypothetical protein
VGSWEWSTGDGFHLVWSATRSMSQHTRLVRNWMLQQAGQTRG